MARIHNKPIIVLKLARVSSLPINHRLYQYDIIFLVFNIDYIL